MADSTLSPERWERVRDLFHLALDQPEAERSAFLDAQCTGDPELRVAVSSLLSAHEQQEPIGGVLWEPVGVQNRIADGLKERYQIIGPLGSGGMATVLLAHDLKHQRKVAIKVLRPELGLTLGIDRFQREIAIAAALQHPHILPLFDSGTTDGLLYYVMPCIEGETLAARMDREGTLPEADALRIVDEVLGALEYAHHQGVVHRDIKPSNILLSSATGHALVADFGIARAVSAAGRDTLTAPGAVLGTPGYMSPEQARGEPISPSVDIYAVGLVLYECLTGRPFPASAHENPSDWTGLAVHRRTIARALRLVPAERWPNARAFRAALKGNSAAGVWRNWKAAVAMAAAAVMVGLGIRWLPRPASDAVIDGGRLAVLPFAVRGGGGLQYLGDGMVDLFSTKLDGAGTLRTVDPRAVLSLVRRDPQGAVNDPVAANRIATRLGAGLFLLGDITEVGGRVQITASLFEGANPEASVARASAEGGEEDVLALLDQMAADLLSQYGQGGDERLARIAVVTTQSFPALKSYLRGIRALRAAEFPIAASAFQEAISADSTFALAWYQMSITADWLLRADLAHQAADQAVRYSARLSERDGRLLEALRTVRRGDVDRAEQVLQAIINTYPDDIEAWSQLSELLFHFGPRHGRPLEDSRPAWQRFTELEPAMATGYIHLARVAAHTRDLKALDSMSRRALELAPEGDRGLEMRALRVSLGMDRAELDRLLTDLAQASDGLFGEGIWSVATFSRDPAIIDPMIRVATAPARTHAARALGYGWSALNSASLGRMREARAALDVMETIDPVRGLQTGGFLAITATLLGDTTAAAAYLVKLEAADWSEVPNSPDRSVWFSVHDGLHETLRWYLIGVLRAVLGDAGGARVAIDSLVAQEVPSGTGSAIPDLANGIRATIARRTGDQAGTERAVDAIQGLIWHQVATASPFFSEAYERYLRALSLEESGRLEEAVQWYGSFAGTGSHDIVFLAPANYRLARLHESLGNTDRARFHYGEFLALRENAEAAAQPLVDSARVRLGLLGR